MTGVRATLVAVVAVLGCHAPPSTTPRATPAAPPPPDRAFAALPVLADEPPDERDLFDMFVARYVASGFPEARDVELELAEIAMIPYTSRAKVITRRFLGDGPAVREHLPIVSGFAYGHRLDAAPRDDAAYRAFMTVTIAHEIAHAIAFLHHDQDQDGWREETRAMALERAALHDAVRAGALPATTIADFDRFQHTLLAAAPPGLVASLPTDPDARRALFIAQYPTVLAGMGGDPSRPHPSPAAVDTVLALYTVVRLELAAVPSPSLASLVARFKPMPAGTP
ncbi:MAG: hypothetical protein NT062_26190 [Proteobacteria bacterium]|nr:hypothetical protein [Pseudomonadota bacterium]